LTSTDIEIVACSVLPFVADSVTAICNTMTWNFPVYFLFCFYKPFQIIQISFDLQGSKQARHFWYANKVLCKGFQKIFHPHEAVQRVYYCYA